MNAIGNDFRPPVTGGAPSEPPSQELGEEDFLKLLMTQIGNQDPLNPMETEQFMNQITAMNSLQQQIASNARLDDLVLAMSALNNETAVNLVGKTVVVEGDTFPHTQGEAEDITFELSQAAETVQIDLVDANGTVVANIEKTDMKAGENTVSWDGLDTDGNLRRDGDLTIRITAKDSDEELIPTRTFVSGTVDELRFDGGFPQVVVGGQVFQLASITRVLGGDVPSRFDGSSAVGTDDEDDGSAADAAAAAAADPDVIAAAEAAADDAAAAAAEDGRPLTSAQRAAVARVYRGL